MNQYDVVIIGGGAAGLSAGLVLSRARRRVAVVDAGAPRNAPAIHMHGFLSRDGVSPSDFLATGRKEVEGYGGQLIDGLVTGTVAGPGPGAGFQVSLADGTSLSTRRVLVATGLRDDLPDIPGVRERWGRDLLHCPYCHGYEIRDQPVAVIGGTADAVQHAQLVRLLVALGCAMDDRGWVVTDAAGQTTVRGVWAAGNAANPRAQVITAAGEGSAAAIALNADLIEEDIDKAVRHFPPAA